MAGLARALILVIGAQAGAAMAAAQDVRLPKGLARLTPELAAERVLVEDDALAPHIIVSGREVWPRGRALRGVHASEVHLRALVDRETGAARWQVWHDIEHAGAAPRLTAVAWREGAGLASVHVVHAGQGEPDCPALDQIKTACRSTARVIFEVPESLARDIAGGYVPGSRVGWPLRFTGPGGIAIDSGLAPAEVAALVATVDALRAEEGLGPNGRRETD